MSPKTSSANGAANPPPSSRTGLAHSMGFHGVLSGGTCIVGAPRALGADGDTPLVHDVERDLLAAGFVV